MRTKEIEQPIDDGPGKPPHIHRGASGAGRSWRRAIPTATSTCSNMPADTLGLSAAAAGAPRRPRALKVCLRRWNLEKALQVAAQEGWVVVSMNDDWKTVFA